MKKSKTCFFILLSSVCALLLLQGCADPKPDLPIEMKYRQSNLSGYVWVFRNTSNRNLEIFATFNRGDSELRSGSLKIPANSEREIGWLEGVTLQQGDQCIASHPDYKTYEGYIPKSFDY